MSFSPIVSIIIPVVNNHNYNRQCLESLFKYNPCDIPHEIIVVDNHSTDGSREYFETLGEKIRLITNNEIKTFAQSCNQGAQEAKSDILLFLNNDTYVTDDWLSPMLQCFHDDPKIGLLANKQLFPKNGLISHVGGAFTLKGNAEHIYLFFDPDLPFLNENREMQWVSACCVAITKKLFDDVHGFDEGYKNSYEDLDLCFKVREKGYKNFFCAQSIIYHYGQATVGRTDNESRNHDLFIERWGERVKCDLAEIAINDHVDQHLESRHQLERLLYERYLFMGHITYVEKLNNNLQSYIDTLHNTLSWRITAPLRNTKQMLKKWFKGGS